jgi:Ca2+-binding RTX toxin-like protein
MASRFHLELERLGARNLLSAGVVQNQLGQVIIRGSKANDAADVTMDGATINVDYNGTTYSFDYDSVTKLVFRGKGGHDTYANGTDVRSLAVGGQGNDHLQGGAANDTLNGGGGNDSVDGGAGNDDVDGDQGNDVVAGGEGDDECFGGTGNDDVAGDEGHDLVAGEAGVDVCHGGSGNDYCNGGGDDGDIIDGDDGDDTHAGGECIDLDRSYHAVLTAEGYYHADVYFTTYDENGITDTDFYLLIECGPPSETVDIVIDGVTIGTITLDDVGYGWIEFSTDVSDTDAEAFPVDFPTIASGSDIAVGNVFQGEFACV